MKSFPQYRINLISVRTRSVMGRTSSLSAKIAYKTLLNDPTRSART